MAFRFVEDPRSRESTGEPPTVTTHWRAIGTQSDSYVRAVAYSATPNIYSTDYGILYRQDIRVDPVGFNIWHVAVIYGKKSEKPPETGQWTFSFDATGGSFHIKTSKETIHKYPVGTAPDFKQLIGVNDGEVEGADVVIPALKLNVTFKHPAGVVTIAYAKTIARLIGKSNSETFLTFAPGEVLMIGASGADGSDAEAEVGYQFACEENLTGQVIGAITDIAKDGWDIAWIKWKDSTEAGPPILPIKVPEWVYIERVYTRVDLGAALGFGG